MLGAYGLLVAPGDFTVISARVLNQLLGGRKSLVGKELTPTILSELAVRIAENPVSLTPWWPFDPEHCPECAHLFEAYLPFPWHRFWRQHSHPHRARAHSQANAEEPHSGSPLSCLGLEEFVDSWTTLRLGESWRVGASSRSDRDLHHALFTLVLRVARATGGLSQLVGLLSRAGNNNLLPTDDNGPSHPLDGGLAVLSAVASSGQLE